MVKYSKLTHYECFSHKIREDLLLMGYKPIYIYRHKKTRNLCYVFKLEPEVERIIEKNSNPEKVKKMRERLNGLRAEVTLKYVAGSV